MATLIVPKSVVSGDALSASGLLRLKHIVPAYQRDYVWTQKTVEQLWDDLIEHYRRYSVDEQLPNPEGYFLGAMVVVLDKDSGKFEVVDGQQRLTSLSTIISILFDYLGKLAVPEPHRSGHEQVARECLGQFVGADWETNLSFSDHDIETFFLNSCLINKTRSEKQTYWESEWCKSKLSKNKSAIYRVYEAIESGYGKLDSFINELGDDDQKKNRLVSLFRMVTECVVVLRISAQSHTNAYAIFESLNNRGIRLSQADLIKNELLKVALPAEREEIIENWSDARQHVDSSAILGLPDLLHLSYLSRHSRVKANDLYENVKAYVASASGVALGYSRELAEDAAAFDALTENYDSKWSPDTHSMLNDIKNVLGIKLCYPYLLSAYRKHSKDKEKFESHVRLVMNFAFRFLKVMDGAVEVLATAVSEASLLVNQGKSHVEVANEVFKKHAPDAQFLSMLESAYFQSTKLAYFAVYYIERAMMKGSVPLPHGVEQNLEHIMPRTPTKKDWPAIADAKDKDPELFKEYLWRIGNLLPLPETINKSIKNKGINYKIANGTGNEYTAAALALVSPKEVSKYLVSGEWTYESIETRQRDLVKSFAGQAWSL